MTGTKGFAALPSDSSSPTPFNPLASLHTPPIAHLFKRYCISPLALFTNTAFKGRLPQKAEFMSIENLKTFGKLGRHFPLLARARVERGLNTPSHEPTTTACAVLGGLLTVL